MVLRICVDVQVMYKLASIKKYSEADVTSYS